MKKDEYVNQMKNISPSEDLIKKTVANIEQVKMQEKIKKTSSWKKILAGAAAMVTLSVGTVGAYIAISGNTEILQKIGINISKNYEENAQDITTQENAIYEIHEEGIDAKIKSISLDNTSLVMEIDMKADDKYDLEDPYLNIINFSAKKQNMETYLNETLEFSQKHSSAKQEDGSYKIFQYISVSDSELAINDFWGNMFYENDIVQCIIDINGIYDGNKPVALIDKALMFDVSKPSNLTINEYTDDSIIKEINYKNVDVKIEQAYQSAFGNVIQISAMENNIDLTKTNDIQKIRIKVMDKDGNELTQVSKEYDSMGPTDYSEGKFLTFTYNVKIVVDDDSDVNTYTYEVVEGDELIVSNDEIEQLCESDLTSLKSGNFVLTDDGVWYPMDLIQNDDEYFVDEYGVYHSTEILENIIEQETRQ